jgi:hypothetical protein
MAYLRRYLLATGLVSLLTFAVLATGSFSDDDDIKADEVARTETTLFHAPVRLSADGAVIDHGSVWGHCGPWFDDVDGDGKKDLLVGDFSGHFTCYRNISQNGEPQFAKGYRLQAGSVDAKVPIY